MTDGIGANGWQLPASLIARLDRYRHARRWWVALSGGVDSVALLLLLHHYGRAHPGSPMLQTLHVNHHLNPASDQWQAYCVELCARLAIPLQVEHLALEGRPGNIEARARQGRYQAMSRHLQADECLFTAHHRGDQAETLLLRLCRGAGGHGLSAMRECRRLGLGWLIRPLLDQSRDQLRDWVVEAGCLWVEDPSNVQQRFDRNFLRQSVLPMLEARFPRIEACLARTALNLQEEQAALWELAVLDGLPAPGEPLALSAAQTLSSARWHNLLRCWLRQQGIMLPSEVQWQALLQLIACAPDRQPQLAWGSWTLRRYQQCLYLTPALAELPTQVLGWSLEQPLQIPGVGCLRATRVAQDGWVLPDRVWVRWRRGGERFRPAQRGGSCALKQWLQEQRIEPWLRPCLPLLYADAACQGELLAVADRGCAESVAQSGPGWRLHWQWQLPSSEVSLDDAEITR